MPKEKVAIIGSGNWCVLDTKRCMTDPIGDPPLRGSLARTSSSTPISLSPMCPSGSLRRW
jgi:hypothetical protein